MSRYFIGIMSGTSLDGVDLAYCDEDIKLIHAKTYPFDEALKKRILKAINGTTTLQEVGLLSIDLGSFFASLVKQFMSEFGITKLDAIGSHGQTLWHYPPHFSMQLGCAHTIASRIGVRVVADFRQKDLTLGGEGAPLAPAFHSYAFASHKSSAVLNIGGMANITILQDPSNNQLIGYDTGCGNVLLDLVAKEKFGVSFDEGGRLAKEGRCDEALLEKMLSEAYFAKSYPKSTGREKFNKAWLELMLDGFSISPRDLLATLAELTATSIAKEAKKHSIVQLIVCGGGAKNDHLLELLRSKLQGVRICTSDELGVSSEFMEAMAFAYLARERLDGKSVKISSVTGASRDTLLGVIYD